MALTGPATMTNLHNVQLRPSQVVGSMFSNPILAGFKRLLAEMKIRQFDAIRFAAYRTANKLRYIQKRTLFCFIDVGKVIEAFREFGLHQVTDSTASLDYPSTACLLNRLYTQLSSTRLPSVPTNDPRTDAETLDPAVIGIANEILLSWLIYALDVAATGRIGVNSLKIALSTLTNSKPVEKLRYHFTLLSDPSGALIPTKFEAYLQDLLRLPISVFEGTNFYFTPQASQALLSGRSKNILVEEFLERMTADPGSQMLVWLTIFHRLASVENIRHNVRCESCKREPISGLRYKCTRCQHYNMCQDCFWTGMTTNNHTNAHDVKEYSTASKSHSRQFGHSLRKSFQLSRLSVTTTAIPSHSDVLTAQSSIGQRPTCQPHKRVMLGSVFEWNSAPASAEHNGTVSNGSVAMQPFTVARLDYAPPIHAGQELGQRQILYRASVPVVRSPFPNRRLQQLNPVLHTAQNNQNLQPIMKICQESVPPSVAPFVSGTPRPFMSTFQRDSKFLGQTGPGGNIPEARLYGAAPSSFQDTQAKFHLAVTPPSCTLSSASNSFGHRQDVHMTFSSPSTSTPGLMSSDYEFTRTHGSDKSERWAVCVPTGPVTSATQSVQPSMATNFGRYGQNVDPQCREEHQLIARYSAQLAAVNVFNAELKKLGNVADSPHTQKQLIAELQQKNRKILKEIERLREEQQKQAAVIAAAAAESKSDSLRDIDTNLGGTLSPIAPAHMQKVDSSGQDIKSDNPQLISELNVLRQRKDELEARMNNLQRNRTELMTQLETLVRLLSLSGTNVHSRDTYGFYPSDAVVRDVHPISRLPSTPVGTTRIGHQSRGCMRPPENPPRRSSSLCHTGEDCVLREDRQMELNTLGRITSNVTPEANWNQVKIVDKHSAADELGRKSLLSPISDLIAEPHLSRTSAGSQPPQADEASRLKELLNRHDRSNINLSGSTSVNVSGRSNTYFSGAGHPSKKNPLTRSICPSDRIYSNSMTDSGSDVYLYSDPEFVSSSGFASIARRDLNNSTRMQKRLSAQIHTQSNGQASSSFSDNYEYPGLITPRKEVDRQDQEEDVGRTSLANQ